MPVINVHRILPANTFDYFITATTFNGGSQSFTIELDATFITQPGEYAVVRSVNPLINYVGATASFVGSTSLTVRSVTASGTGDVRVINGTSYYCICVTVS
jgi:hypothetical protein